MKVSPAGERKRAWPNTAVYHNKKGKMMKMNNRAYAGEQQQKSTAALRQQMGMADAGSAADAVRWFSISVPDENLCVKLSTAALEGRVDLVATVFGHSDDVEPLGYAVCYRTRTGADFHACLPVELSPGAPLALFSPGNDRLYQLDERCALSRQTEGLAGKSMRVAHQRAMKRLRRAARAISPRHSNLPWQDLRGATEISIPRGKVSKVTVLAA